MSAQDNDTPRNLFREMSNTYLQLKREGKQPQVIALSKAARTELNEAPEMRLPSDIPQPKHITFYGAPAITIDWWEGVLVQYMDAIEFLRLYIPATIEAFYIDGHHLTAIEVNDTRKVLFEYDAMKDGNKITIPFTDEVIIREAGNLPQALIDMAVYGLQRLYEYNADTPFSQYDLWEKVYHARKRT